MRSNSKILTENNISQRKALTIYNDLKHPNPVEVAPFYASYGWLSPSNITSAVVQSCECGWEVAKEFLAMIQELIEESHTLNP